MPVIYGLKLLCVLSAFFANLAVKVLSLTAKSAKVFAKTAKLKSYKNFKVSFKGRDTLVLLFLLSLDSGLALGNGLARMTGHIASFWGGVLRSRTTTPESKVC